MLAIVSWLLLLAEAGLYALAGYAGVRAIARLAGRFRWHRALGMAMLACFGGAWFAVSVVLEMAAAPLGFLLFVGAAAWYAGALLLWLGRKAASGLIHSRRHGRAV